MDSRIKKLIDQAVIHLGKSGIVGQPRRSAIAYTTTQQPGGNWIYARYTDKNCVYLKTFLYELISKKLPKEEQFIPSECQSCYKVVARPYKYTDLLKIREIMKEMDESGKCGIEKRESVDALYGAYWYCNGIEEGKTRLEQVETALKGIDGAIFLKRSCTEYELDFGPSDEWEIKPNQMKIEEEVNEKITINNFKYPQPNKDIERIMKEWAIFAEKLGPDYIGSHNYVIY